MKTCEYAGDPFTEPRSHPWVRAAADPAGRYYDLTAEPARIRSSLEDFRPWKRYAAVELFYSLLERLNQSTSPLESNDCAFTGPEPNENEGVQKALQCSGRVMVLFRALERNVAGGQVEGLANQLHRQLVHRDPKFRWGVIGTTIVPVRYLALPEAAGGQLGSQLMISFWAWGDSEGDNMSNLERLLENLSQALSSLLK
jgi:hypothetical protein